MAAATPLAWIAATIGRRTGFPGLAALAVLVAVLPAGMGYIIEGFGNSAQAYRPAFAALAAGLVLGAGVYLRSRDSSTASPA